MAATELLVIGHVTCDRFREGERLGGASSFAARAASALGVPTALLTTAPPASPLLQPLLANDSLALHIVPSEQMTTFSLDYSGTERKLSLLARAPSLTAQMLPAEAATARALYVAPVAGECSRDIIEAVPGTFVGVGLQGWLRSCEVGEPVHHAILDEARAPPPGVKVAVFSVEDHPEAEALAAALAARGVVVALTRSSRGASLYTSLGVEHIDAAVAQEKEPTGAGDVFGVVFTVALERGASVRAAASLAREAAARVVEGFGLGRLPEAAGELGARLAAF